MVTSSRATKLCDKQRRLRKSNHKSYFDEIPNELITTVFARVASSSIADLHNAKLSCKTLRSICDDSYVLKHATIENIPVIPWPLKGSTKAFSETKFVELCLKNGNPEALYRKGIVDYLGGRRDDALECLRIAEECGHLAASYTIGIILILTGEKKKGMQQLGKIKKQRNLITEVTKCRNKLMAIIQSVWVIKNDEFVREKPTCCSSQDQHKYRKGWCLEDDEKKIECEACLCDIEVNCMYDSLMSKLL